MRGQIEIGAHPIHHIGFSGYAASLILGREAYVGGAIQQWREMKALWDGPDAHAEFLERSKEDAVAVGMAVENDILRLSYWRWLPRPKPTKKIDGFTFSFEDGKNGYIMRFDPQTELFRTERYGTAYGKSCILQKSNIDSSMEGIEAQVEVQEKELENYQSGEDADMELQTTIEKYKDYVIRIDAGGLGIGYSQAMLETVAIRPELISRYINVQVEKAVKSMASLAASGVKIVFGGGDMATSEGPFYSPKVFRQIMLPALKKITGACHKHGIYYFFGSDGNLWPVADDLFGRSGVDGYYEIDRRAGMDLGRLREQFPHLTLIGNISSHTLHLGTKEEVVKEVTSCIEAAKRYGRLIVGVSNYILPGTPKENIMATLNTIKKYKRML